MAVEARYLNILPSQLTSNRSDFIKPTMNVQALNANMYNNTQMDSRFVLNETMPRDTNALMQLYQYSLANGDPFSGKASMNNHNNNKSDSGLTYINNVSSAPQRKRPRDINEFEAFTVSQKPKVSSFTPSIDEDTIFQIQQQQSDINRFIAEHTEKVRMELEEKRKRQSSMLMSAIQEGITKKLNEKDEEIRRIGKLNWVLQERVKSLYVENQIWRDLAQTNEATANSLRTNLEQVLAHVGEERRAAAAPVDDAESSCGSCGQEPCNLAEEDEANSNTNKNKNKGTTVNRLCKICGERESSVLLLPCRHLCLCTLCGSTLSGNCPVCDSVMNATVHVNMS